AVQRLQTFVSGGPQTLIDSGLLRLGWWSRAAGQPLDAATAYRGMLSAYPRAREASWARAGLVQALLDLDDYAAARDEAKKLEQAGRSGPGVVQARPDLDDDAAARDEAKKRQQADRRGCLVVLRRLLMSRWATGKAR